MCITSEALLATTGIIAGVFGVLITVISIGISIQHEPIFGISGIRFRKLFRFKFLHDFRLQMFMFVAFTASACAFALKHCVFLTFITLALMCIATLLICMLEIPFLLRSDKWVQRVFRDCFHRIIKAEWKKENQMNKRSEEFKDIFTNSETAKKYNKLASKQRPIRQRDAEIKDMILYFLGKNNHETDIKEIDALYKFLAKKNNQEFNKRVFTKILDRYSTYVTQFVQQPFEQIIKHNFNEEYSYIFANVRSLCSIQKRSFCDVVVKENFIIVGRIIMSLAKVRGAHRQEVMFRHNMKATIGYLLSNIYYEKTPANQSDFSIALLISLLVGSVENNEIWFLEIIRNKAGDLFRYRGIAKDNEWGNAFLAYCFCYLHFYCEVNQFKNPEIIKTIEAFVNTESGVDADNEYYYSFRESFNNMKSNHIFISLKHMLFIYEKSGNISYGRMPSGRIYSTSTSASFDSLYITNWYMEYLTSMNITYYSNYKDFPTLNWCTYDKLMKTAIFNGLEWFNWIEEDDGTFKINGNREYKSQEFYSKGKNAKITQSKTVNQDETYGENKLYGVGKEILAFYNEQKIDSLKQLETMGLPELKDVKSRVDSELKGKLYIYDATYSVDDEKEMCIANCMVSVGDTTESLSNLIAEMFVRTIKQEIFEKSRAFYEKNAVSLEQFLEKLKTFNFDARNRLYYLSNDNIPNVKSATKQFDEVILPNESVFQKNFMRMNYEIFGKSVISPLSDAEIEQLINARWRRADGQYIYNDGRGACLMTHEQIVNFIRPLYFKFEIFFKYKISDIDKNKILCLKLRS